MNYMWKISHKKQQHDCRDIISYNLMQFKPMDFMGGFCDINESREMPFCIRINMLLSLEVVIVHCKQKWCQMMSNDTSNPQINRVFSTAVVYGISLHWIVLRSNRYCKIIFKMDTYELDLTIGWVFFQKAIIRNIIFLSSIGSDLIQF